MKSITINIWPEKPENRHLDLPFLWQPEIVYRWEIVSDKGARKNHDSTQWTPSECLNSAAGYLLSGGGYFWFEDLKTTQEYNQIKAKLNSDFHMKMFEKRDGI
jgi:hypothetical protein